MRRRLFILFIFLLGLPVSTVLSVSSANAQCPAFGADTTCGVIITIGSKGATVASTGQGPYDGNDDTSVGIVNNSAVPIKSLVLTSGLPIFAFDGDGIDTYGAASNAMDDTGYGGPNAYYTNYTSTNSGTVNFIVPIAANGGTGYFSLENALGMATGCTDLINNAVHMQVSGPNICATFTPNQNYTLSQAEQLCGFTNFDWVQQITTQFDPSAFYARNQGGAFDSTVAGIVRLTSKRVPWSDPPQGGGYAPKFGGGATPDNSYPFYYDPNVDLPAAENGTQPAACTLPVTAGNTLTFHDLPNDPCLPGGPGVGQARCRDSLLAPGATAEPAGSFGGYQTHLAGINPDGTATDLGIGFTWTSDYNGSTGAAKKTDLRADAPGAATGSGGVTITSETAVSTYQGVTVTGVNGAGVAVAGKLESGTACNGLYSGTFDGDITVSTGQACTFVGGYITGNVVARGGSLELSSVLVGGNVHITDDATFNIGPSASIAGNLEIRFIRSGAALNQVCGSTVHGNLDFHANGTAVQIGSASATTCIGNKIKGDLEVGGNSAATTIYGNKINGGLQDHANTGASQVSSNSVRGVLRCWHDAQISGGSNKAVLKEGQCKSF